jgi:hypothetical protein
MSFGVVEGAVTLDSSLAVMRRQCDCEFEDLGAYLGRNDGEEWTLFLQQSGRCRWPWRRRNRCQGTRTTE